MKFCKNCGNQLADEAAFCMSCGVAVDNATQNQNFAPNPYAVPMHQNSGLTTAAKIFIIIACVLQGFFIIPLAWCLPLTIVYCGKVNRGERVGTGLKIALLLLVSMIGGILALCADSE